MIGRLPLSRDREKTLSKEELIAIGEVFLNTLAKAKPPCVDEKRYEEWLAERRRKLYALFEEPSDRLQSQEGDGE